MRDMQPKVTMPPTGAEFLHSLNDGREVWIYGERVRDVTQHPAFRNSARSLARLYDAMHDPVLGPKILVPTDTGSGGMTHAFFRNPTTKDDLRAGRQAIETWQRQVFGWMGRTPDYKAALLTKLGAMPEFFGEYADNARNWYGRAQEGVLHMAHAIVNPPVDRHRNQEEVRDVYVHVEKETDAGIVISGAKVVATGAPITQYLFVSYLGAPVKDDAFGLAFIAPVNAPGVKLLCRASYEFGAAAAGSPYDYPLSSRLDENDAILVFDKALIPWENILVYSAPKINEFVTATHWESRAILQAATRMGVKMEFLAGALSKALDVTGAGVFRGVEAGLGEVINWCNLVRGLRDGMIEDAAPGFGGSMVPSNRYAFAYATVAPRLYSRIKEIIETCVASGLIYLNSHASDLTNPEIRPYFERYLRGSNGLTVDDRTKTMKLLWDAIGSEFGGRHELYELNYLGAPELNHLMAAQLARDDGQLSDMRGLVETCMNDYDVNGWSVEDFVAPGAASAVPRR